MRYLKLNLPLFLEIVDEIKTRMVREVDFIEEAQNLDDFVGIFKYFPKIKLLLHLEFIIKFSTRRVLTMQRLYGVPLTDFSVVKQYAKDPSQVLITRHEHMVW
ncbi:AarF/UbiB family protein [Acinetobacter baumannii]